MFEITGREARVDLRSQEEAESVISKLDRNIYKSATRSMMAAGFESAGVRVDATQLLAMMRGSAFLRPGRPEPRSPVGEVFFTENELFVLTAILFKNFWHGPSDIIQSHLILMNSVKL